MAIQERLKMVIKMHNLSASSFADTIGVQRSNVSHILGGRNKPSIDFLEKTLTHFPRVNAMWLITGKTQETNHTAPERKETTLVDTDLKVEKENNVQNPQKKIDSQKEIEKIIIFYTDKSFEINRPSEQ
jgi:transcriptional regulator with XRE-family HTH domain